MITFFFAFLVIVPIWLDANV